MKKNPRRTTNLRPRRGESGRRPEVRLRPEIDRLERRLALSLGLVATPADGPSAPESGPFAAEVFLVEAPHDSAETLPQDNTVVASAQHDDADGAVTAGAWQLLSSELGMQTTPHEVVFLDPRVPQAQVLLNDLLHAPAETPREVVVLNPKEDGVAQMSAFLADESNVTSVQIISHGSDGALLVGDSLLDSASLGLDRDALNSWRHALSPGADLLLYGCDVAADAVGQRFVATLASLTGTHVAANTGPTGTAALGGAWTLDFQTSTIDAAPVLDAADTANWTGLLAITTVTNTNDSGPGSLRQAMLGLSPGSNTIDFDIPGTGVHTISVDSALPTVVDTVTIDGTSQPGYSGTPLIQIENAGTPYGTNAIAIEANNCAIKGLAIGGFTGNAIAIANANGTIVQSNFLGTDATGTVATANGSGVVITGGSDNLIGGATASDRNVISGNNGDGVRLEVGASANTIVGNEIGTNLTGSLALPNGFEGVEITDASANAIGLPGEGNVISGNTGAGIEIDPSSTGNNVEANLIGINAAGDSTLGNGAVGVLVDNAMNNSIGGIIAGAGNVIGGNAANGVEVDSGSNGTTIEGNFIGTNASGTINLGNQQNGIWLKQSAGDIVTVGGTTAGAGNLIENNGYAGVNIDGGGTGAAVIGNTIGTDGGLGIDINNDGVTANQPLGTTGPNDDQVYPVITAARTDGKTLTITGSINVVAGHQYLIQIFGDPAADASGHGPGEKLLTSYTFTASSTGLIESTQAVTTPAAVGSVVTSTCTDLTTNSTSEFSQDATVVLASTIVVNTTSDVSDGNTSSILALATSPGADGVVSLREAILAANNTPEVAGVPITIEFDIPGSALQTINLTSALPTITNPVVIDGYTQPGSSDNTAAVGTNAVLTVAINGANIAAASGLTLGTGSTGSTVEGLNIHEFNSGGNPYANGWGIHLNNSSNDSIIGNFIGTNAAGTATVANQSSGIVIDGGSGNLIGGTDPADRNLISGNGAVGVWINSSDETVEGNLIGTNAAGAPGLGNSWSGVEVYTGDLNVVGGTSAGAENVITSNGIAGILVANGSYTQNSFLENSIYDNASIGIDLGGNGVTSNSTTLRNGPNNLMSSPVLSSAIFDGNQLAVVGYIGSTPQSSAFAGSTVELFVSDGSVGTFGSGKTYLGTLTADANGNFDGQLTLPPGVTLNASSILTGTATDAGGDTSEFGPNLAVTAATPLQNGGFESGPRVTSVSVFGYGSTAIVGWTVLQGSVDLSTGIFENGLTAPGNQVVDLNGTDTGGLQQSFSTTPGETYTLSFEMAGNVNGSPAIKTMNVLTPSGTTAESFDTTGFTTTNMGWSLRTVTFTATSSLSTIQFLSTTPNSSCGPMLDNVSIVPGLAISGHVFDDVNYGGGSGRDYIASGENGVANAIVELYDASGNEVGSTTTNASGYYTFSGLVSSQYEVRVVSSSVTSTRAGENAALLPVQTFRTDATTGTVVNVTDEVGGANPGLEDAGPGQTTLAALTTATTTAESVSTVAIGASAINGIDFGFNFDTVVNTNDSGQGSLRQFLLNANALSNTGLAQVGRVAGIDNAVFMIPNGTADPGLNTNDPSQFSGGVATIDADSQLPTITDPVILDATNQPGYVDTPIVALDGANARSSTDGLLIASGESKICGLAIDDFGNDGIGITSAGGNTIIGNDIGTSSTGTVAAGNGVGIGISDGSSGNMIGGTSAESGNVISGNGGSGIELDGTVLDTLIEGNTIGTNAAGNAAIPNGLYGISVNGALDTQIGGTSTGEGNLISGNASAGIGAINGADGTVIEGNRLGTDSTGSFAVHNGAEGIYIVAATNTQIGGTTIGAGNLISGNLYSGLHIESGCAGTIVEGNSIGLNASGTAAIGNGADGIHVYGTVDLVIGGITSGAGNTISGNASDGILIQNGATDTQITGNFIGTDTTATRSVPNGGSGIELDAATGTIIGGTTLSARNVLSGNDASGIELAGSGVMSNVIESNLIGLSADGATLVGNIGPGIVLSGGASSNSIGPANTIAGNANGVVVTDTSTNDSILSNSIWGNTGLGIDLNDDGVTLNHPGGSTLGPNDLENYPVIALANSTGGVTWLAGTLNSVSNTSFRLEFFDNPAPGDPSGHGQGKTFLGFENVTTDATGNVAFATSFPFSLAAGSVISATATVNLGGGQFGSTSEFAANVVSTALKQGITVSPVSGLITTQAGGTATFTVVLDAPPTGKVSIPVFSSNTTQGTVSTNSLTFTSANWKIPQTVTITGANDQIADGDTPYSVSTGTAISTDSVYNGMPGTILSVINKQTDVAGYLVTPQSGLVTNRGGASASFTVKLTSEPLAPVSMSVASSNTSQGVVNLQVLVFDSNDWNVPQTVTVTGVQAYMNEASVAYSVLLGPATSLDLVYNGLAVPSVSVTNLPIADRPPVLTVPGLQTIPAYGAVVFGSAGGNGIVLSDPDAGPNVVQLALNVSEGTLTLATLAGITVVDGGNSTGAITIKGTIAALNAAIDGLRYVPSPGHIGTFWLMATANDLGETGTGGPLTDSELVPILVQNDAPNLVTTPPVSLKPIDEVFAPSVNPGTPLDNITGLEETDPDPGAMAGLAITGADAAHGVWQFTTDGGAEWTDLGNVSDQQAVLLKIGPGDSIRFLPEPHYFGTANLILRAWDGTDGLPDGQAGVNVSTNGGNTAYGNTTASVTENIDRVYLPPQVNDATFVVAPGMPLVVNDKGVLASATASDGDPLTARIVQPPLHGTLILRSDGTFVYQPEPGWYGIDTFKYLAVNGPVTSASATVTLTVLSPQMTGNSGALTPPLSSPTVVTGGNSGGGNGGGASGVLVGGGRLGQGVDGDGSSVGNPGNGGQPAQSASGATTVLIGGSSLSGNGPRSARGSATSNGARGNSGGGSSAAVAGSGAHAASPAVTVLIGPQTGAGGASVFGISAREGHEQAGRQASLARSDSGDSSRDDLAKEASLGGLVINSRVLGDALDQMSEGLTSGGEVPVVTVTVVMGMSVSIGYVIWTARASYLVAAMLATTPLWREFDPLSVLDEAGQRRMFIGNEDEDDEEDGHSLVSLVERGVPSRPHRVRQAVRTRGPRSKRTDRVL